MDSELLGASISSPTRRSSDPADACWPRDPAPVPERGRPARRPWEACPRRRTDLTRADQVGITVVATLIVIIVGLAVLAFGAM
jgi:hypothetical protein